MKGDIMKFPGDYSAIPGGRDNTILGGADYSLAFGNGVSVSSNYIAAFFSSSHTGTVRITDVLILTPRAGAPPAIEGTIYVNSTNNHIWCYINGTWRQLDN